MLRLLSIYADIIRKESAVVKFTDLVKIIS